MAVIILRDQKKAFLNGAEQTGLFIAGQKVWAKPATAPVSIFSLATPRTGSSGFSLSNATDTGITLTDSATGRSWISWSVTWAAGSRIVFDWANVSSVSGLRAVLDDVIGISAPNLTVLPETSGMSGSVDYTIPAGGTYAYFGFGTPNGSPIQSINITNFAVYAP